jgi:predicted aspartyl protease
MKKYFQLHDYPSRVEAIISTYHLQGKTTMWWDQIEQAKNLDEKRISWRQFKRYFQEKYFSENYYERKMKEFFELKLGTMTMEEYEKQFFEFLKYVDFIKDEKVKIQRFLSGFPSFYSDKIQYDNPKNLEESIRRARHIYEQNKGRTIFQKAWNDKMEVKKDHRHKGFKPPFFKNNYQANQQVQLAQNEHKTVETFGKMPRQQPVQCWGCEGNHLYRDYPHKGERMRTVHNIQEVETVDDMGGNMPRIYVALENKQAEYQSPMIEVKGKISNRPITNLIDYGASHSYINDNIVERFHLQRSKNKKSWLVQLATRAKIKINELVKECLIDMNGLSTKVDVNITPLGSYDCLIGMDWLEKHHAVLDYYNKTIVGLLRGGVNQ